MENESNNWIARTLDTAPAMPVIVSAGVRDMSGSSTYWFQITYDMGSTHDADAAMSTTMSKQYDTYDEAVLAMNERIFENLSFDLVKDSFDEAWESIRELVRGKG